MDCCNYMQYRQHNYYGSHYYDPLSAYHSEFYGQQFYQDYYGASPYYQQQWQCAPFSDYVYNPKEARIRKAMREATRDRSIGASPMLPRPNARRPAHWMTPHEEQLMLSPLASMRAAMENPVCSFPLSGPGTSQYMPSINGYNKIDAQIPSSSSVHSNYIQTNPLAQLQQQTEMWHSFPENVRSNPTGNPFMVPETSSFQHHPPGTPIPHSMPPCDKQESPSPLSNTQHQPQTPEDLMIPCESGPDGTPIIDSVAMSSPSDPVQHNNTVLSTNSNPDAKTATNPPFTQDKDVLDVIQPIMKSGTQQQNDHYMPMYDENAMKNSYERVDKVKKLQAASQMCAPHNRSSNGLNTINGRNTPNNSSKSKPAVSKALPDFNEAFGCTERGRFQSPPDPRIVNGNKGYMDYFFDANSIKFDEYQN